MHSINKSVEEESWSLQHVFKLLLSLLLFGLHLAPVMVFSDEPQLVPETQILKSQRRLHEMLGLEEGCQLRDVMLAYRDAAMACHPDHNPGDSMALVRFKRLNEAYTNFISTRSAKKEEPVLVSEDYIVHALPGGIHGVSVDKLLGDYSHLHFNARTG